MRPQIKLTPFWVARSRQFAERCVLGYERGEKETSRQYARPGIDKSVDAQFKGRAGECAFCIYLGLDPETALDWSPRPDSGRDLIVRESRVDVKTTDTEHLIWPVTKNHFLEQCGSDVFVLVRRIEDDLYEISGWVTVKNFIAMHHNAPPPDYFDVGTKCMHMDELREFTDATRAGHRNGFVGYDAEDRFVHYCHCGANALFGYGVNLRAGKTGRWFCKDHRPTTEERAHG